MLTKLLRWAAAVTAILVALRLGYFRLGTVFLAYDDEGYLLLSIKHYMAGARLYTQVFTQYGPVFYFIESFLFRLLHQPVTHDAGRSITLLLWMASSVAAAWFVYRLSRNVFIASAAGLVLMMLSSLFLVNEPDHPQNIILLLLMLACCASLLQAPLALLLLAAIGAALVFIKINVGIFFFAALFATLVCVLRPGVLRRIGSAVFLAYFLLAPLALMHRDLHRWALPFCSLAILCGVATLTAALFASASLPSHRFATARATLPPILAGAALVCALVLLATALQQMPFRTLLDGVLFAPLRQPELYELPWRIPFAEILAPALAVCAVVLVYWRRRVTRRSTAWIVFIRGLAGLSVAAMIVLGRQSLMAPALLLLPLGLLPAAARPGSGSQYVPRLFVTLLAAAELLQSYPVAGTQQVIAAAPVVLWAFLCIADAAVEIMRRWPALIRAHGALPTLGTVLGALLLLYTEAQVLVPRIWKMRFPYPASALHGATSLHLPPAAEHTFEAVTADISRNCDVLFTLPGMGSLNLWSGLPTPNGMMLTAWVKALRPDQQDGILRILSGDPDACVVVRPRNIWKITPADLQASPLATYMVTQMRPVAAIAGYEIRVNPRRTRPWIDAAPPAAASQPAHPRLDHTPTTVLPSE